MREVLRDASEVEDDVVDGWSTAEAAAIRGVERVDECIVRLVEQLRQGCGTDLWLKTVAFLSNWCSYSVL